MIKVNHLTKRYGDFCLDISLEIPAGRVTGIVGRNGAGKSTTIKTLLGLVKPDEGLVEILGKEVSRITKEDREQMGVALSDSGFSMYLNAEDVSKIMKKMYHDFDEAAFKQKLMEQKLPMKKQIKDYSTGMKAKLRVLVALSHKAKLLILDEPTAGLDVLARNEILDMLREYIAEDENRTIVITSHISSDLEGLCDDIYMIHNGKVILHEDTDVILGNYGVLKLTNETFEKLDKSYLLKTKKSDFGYTCFTNEKQYYLENYPGIVIENATIDEMIVMMADC